MKTMFNRFAVLPHYCNCCGKYVWLEPYRKADVFHLYMDGYLRENICVDCIDNYEKLFMNSQTTAYVRKRNVEHEKRDDTERRKV